MTPATPTARMARWLRPVPAALLLVPFLLLAPSPDRGQGKSAEDQTPKKANGETAVPVEIEVRFTDDSVLKMTLRDRDIALNTRHGRLLIAAADLRHIDFGTRIPDAVARRVDTLIANLGHSQFTVRQAAGTELVGLREKSYPALLEATRHKDLEVARRAEALVKKLRDAVPADQLAFRKDDVVRTADARLVGRIEGDALKAETVQFGAVELKPGHVRSLQNVSVLPDPGNLEGLRDLTGKTFRFKVTGTSDGPVYGAGTYRADSVLASAAVHAGALKPGERGVIRVTIVNPPGAWAGSAANGVTSVACGSLGGAFQVSR